MYFPAFTTCFKNFSEADLQAGVCLGCAYDQSPFSFTLSAQPDLKLCYKQSAASGSNTNDFYLLAALKIAEDTSQQKGHLKYDFATEAGKEYVFRPK